jgi:hypothetical protein
MPNDGSTAEADGTEDTRTRGAKWLNWRAEGGNVHRARASDSGARFVLSMRDEKQGVVLVATRSIVCERERGTMALLTNG